MCQTEVLFPFPAHRATLSATPRAGRSADWPVDPIPSIAYIRASSNDGSAEGRATASILWVTSSGHSEERSDACPACPEHRRRERSRREESLLSAARL